jgi:hypothetical protein
MGTGNLPIRDMASNLSVPNVAENFAAHPEAAAALPGENALRRRKDRQPQAVQHLRDLVLAAVHPPPGPRNALQPVDRALAAGAVLERDADGLLDVGVDDLEAVHEPLVGQDAHDGHLHPRRGNVHGLVLGHLGVADARQEIGDRIRHAHLRSPTSSPW